MNVDLSKYDNSHFEPGNPLKRGTWYIFNMLFFKSYLFPFYGLKTILLRAFGARVGTGVIIKPGVNIKYPWKLIIGNHTWIGENAWIDNLGLVTLGNNVCLSQGCMLLCGNHDYKKQTFDLIVNDIIIRDGGWIGAKAVVCGGVIVNEQAVLTVSSVATTSLDANTIYQGNPAIKVKERIID